MTIAVQASDPDGSVSQVDVFVNGSWVSGTSTTPFSVSWTPSEQGSYVLTAAATDNQGASSTSGTVTVTVTAPCSYSVTPTALDVSANAGNQTISVSASAACSWQAVSQAAWLSITSGNGTGTGTVSFTTAANGGSTSRTTQVLVAGQAMDVTQDAPLTAPPAPPTPVLGISGSQFTVNGAPKFLVFVSYVDAMRRSYNGGSNDGDLDTDLRYLAAFGYDGIRIFPNWYHYLSGAHADDDGLFTSTGSIRTAQWPVFLRVRDTAAKYGLLVDVSFTMETISNLSRTDYRSALQSVAAALTGYHNLVFDLQNEFTDDQRDSTADIQSFVSAVHSSAGDPARLVTASIDAGTVGDPVVAGQDFNNAGVQIAAYHDHRDPGTWYTDAAINSAVAGLKQGMGASPKPVYLQEPMPFATIGSNPTYDPTPGHARAAASAAKRAGAAAWTFHTRTTFDLATSKLRDLAPDRSDQALEIQAIRRTAWQLLPGQSWPSENGSYRLTYQTDGNLVLIRASDSAVMWWTNTQVGDPEYFYYQSDGNFVGYHGSRSAYWTSNTFGNPPGSLSVKTDGRLLIYNAAGSVIWWSGPGGTGRLNGNNILFPGEVLLSPDGRYLSYQSDGNLVLYRADGSPTWATNTFGTPGYAILQTDGNLVVYDGSGAAQWSSVTFGNPGAYLQLQTDGNLVIYSSSGGVLWASGTAE